MFSAQCSHECRSSRPPCAPELLLCALLLPAECHLHHFSMAQALVDGAGVSVVVVTHLVPGASLAATCTTTTAQQPTIFSPQLP